jgi:hypothetical protein
MEMDGARGNESNSGPKLLEDYRFLYFPFIPFSISFKKYFQKTFNISPDYLPTILMTFFAIIDGMEGLGLC